MDIKSIFKDRKLKAVLACLLMACMVVLLGEAVFAASSPVTTATGKVNARSGAYLRKSSTTSSAKITLLKDNTTLKIQKEVFTSKTRTSAKTRWYYVTAGSRKGYIRADLVDTIKYKAVKMKTTDALNYRVGPSVSMTRKGTFKKNANISVVLESAVKGGDTWYKVKKGTKYYYVCGAYVDKIKSASSNNNNDTTAAATNTTSEQTNKPAAEPAVKTDSEPSKAAETRITTSDITYPTSIGEGSPFALRGTIESTDVITSVKAGVTNTSGSWVISTTAMPEADSFDIKDIDALIKFGTLTPGKYIYRIDVSTSKLTKTVASYKFEVRELEWPDKLAAKAIELAWPLGTPADSYTYGKGTATDAYKSAMESVFPDLNNWGKVTKSGASCDIFICTVCKAAGYDSSMPKARQTQSTYLQTSPKWNKVNYSFKESELRSGDIIIYKRSNGDGHICMYVKINGKGYLAEAAYKSKFGCINTSIRKVISPAQNVIELNVYRAAS